ncbi:MAG: thiol:disulfide interchange protein DsbA/DsbL [Gammaproteobacteria bacterium]|nr:thiol:disulfide interchange protein DsbA/DsbL [Gammaproteobacteria bacterium]
MKSRFVALLSLLLIPVTGVLAQELSPSQYKTLPARIEVETSGPKVEVREFFWYGCMHCNALEPTIQNWLKHKPANVAFVRTPATFGRWALHAQAYYAFEALDALDKLHSAMFYEIHEKKRRLDSEEAIAEFAAEHGIPAAKFTEAFNSFGVRLKLEKAKHLAEAAGIDSVPTLLVDGRWVTSPELAGGGEAALKVVDQLVAKVAKERPSASKAKPKSKATKSSKGS